MRRTLINVPEIKMNVHEWLRMIMNDCEWLWTFTNVHERWTFTKVREGSNEGSRIRTSGSYEWPELYVNEILLNHHASEWKCNLHDPNYNNKLNKFY